MNRWLVAITIVFATRVASAKIVVRVPMVSDTCPTGASWDEVASCLRGFGDVKLLNTTKTTRVAQVTKQVDDELRDSGTYLYIATGKGWILGGMSADAGELLAFESITIANHRGYRLDFARVLPTTFTFDDGTTIQAPLATRATMTSVYCAGDSQVCTEAVTSCDLFVRGRAYRTFRGVVRIHDYQLAIVGDRTKAGDCAPEETLMLRWPAAH